ncbi:MAG: STAS domain-containing protein [Alteromonadales bacterium]|nr:STAS domain-containing protein [Alteromonadales bacterium]
MDPQKVALSRKQIGGEVPMVATEITDNCIYSGLFGSLDSSRMATIIDKITSLANLKQISLVIIDLGNVEAIDSSVAGYLVKLGNILSLVGVMPIFCGISAELAKTMATAEVDLGSYLIERDLKAALMKTFEINKQTIVSLN